MSANVTNLLGQAMALPVADRVELAQALWSTLDEDRDAEVAAILADVRRRQTEWASDPAVGRSHDDVMQTARDAI